MRLRRKEWRRWHWEAVGWRGSIMFGRYRCGVRRVSPGVWSAASPLGMATLIIPWRPDDD